MSLIKNINYSYQDIESRIRCLAPQILQHPFDGVLGLTRGGLVPAVVLSHLLNVPMATMNITTRDNLILGRTHVDTKKKFLIVDDICDSGKTLSMLSHIEGPRFVVVNCVNRHSQRIDFSCFEVEDDDSWINFPWELTSS